MPFTARALLLFALLASPAALLAEGSAANVQTAVSAVGPGVGDLGTVRIEAARLGGLEVSESGAADYRLTAEDIDRMPGGSSSPLASVLAQLPGVAIDANQQIHIRDTEGPQFQYQINGFLVPIDINTNPSLLSLLNALFVERLELELGVLPVRYGFATGGIVELTTKDGCRAPGAAASVTGGQRATSTVSAEYAGCDGALGSYLSLRGRSSDAALSSATPGPVPVHDHGRDSQALGYFSYALGDDTRFALLLAATRSDEELPNQPGLVPAFTLAGAPAPPSANIDSRLGMRDYLIMASVQRAARDGLDMQLGYAGHLISERFSPDPVGELVYQGVASAALHEDHDHTLQGDVRAERGAHTLSAGLYVGLYRADNRDDSLAFPVGAGGSASSDVPRRILAGSSATNVVAAAYVGDRWHPAGRLSVDFGLREDLLTGYTHARQLSPRLNVVLRPDADAVLHAGFARYLQVPSLLGISASTQPAFAGTTAAGPPGIALPLAEDDYEFDAGLALQATSTLALSLDGYFERTIHYLDTGQFGTVPIFAPFNYGHGHLWGAELGARYREGGIRAYLNLTTGKNWQQGVATGQFNFPVDELAYIDQHAIVLDHQPALGASAGLSYQRGSYTVSGEALYSSGLSTGFADTQTLPETVQVNASLERTLSIAAPGSWSVRIAVLNVFDRVNEIRARNGIGIFQAAYGARRTALATLSLRY